MTGRAVARALVAACLLLAGGAGPAHAHGDPASHYLETDQLYPSFANRPSQQVELQLLGLLDAARDRGYPIKVVLLGGVDDVSEAPGMLRRPQAYAEFVESELEGALEAPMVVVSPHGIGIAGSRGRPVDLPVSEGADGNALAVAAMTAVRRLARATGHPLPAHVPPAPALVSRSSDTGSGLSDALPLIVFAAVFGAAWLVYEVRRRIQGHAPAQPATLEPGRREKQHRSELRARSAKQRIVESDPGRERSSQGRGR